MLAELAVLAICYGSEHQHGVAVVLVVALLLHRLLVVPFYTSPLRHVPGPYWHRVSFWPSVWAQYRCLWVKRVHQLHEQYGNVVLLSPTEVSFNGDHKYVRDIYTRNMPKLAHYKNFRALGYDNLFSTTENDRHLRYKKALLGLYLKSSVFASTRPFLEHKARLLLQQVHQTNAKGVDVYLLFGALALDVVSAFELGPHNGTNMLQDPAKREILASYRLHASTVFCRAPAFLDHVLRCVSSLFPSQAKTVVEDAHMDMFKKALPVSRTTFEALTKNGVERIQAFSFISDNIVAGHETTAFQLTYLSYELSRPVNKHRQEVLHCELQRAFGRPSSPSDVVGNLEKLDSLPYLEALVWENLRVHTSGAGSLPRVCPAPYPLCLSGRTVTLPIGTVVSCQAYLLHRDKGLFPDGDKWIPERWLQYVNESEDNYRARTAHMKRDMMLFGKGVRMCLGMHLALIEIKIAIANLYWHYGSTICGEWCTVTEYGPDIKVGNAIEVGPGVLQGDSDENRMMMVDAESSRPYCDECWLQWSVR
uniref:CYP5217B1 n=1 Tax=Danielia oregonensis TaxID=46584 RepID=A0A1B3B2L5_9ASCO|nr:CYP5217B1 [[Candida] oregonensis]